MARLAVLLGILAGLKAGGADVAITSPANGTVLATPVVDVAVTFSSGKGKGQIIDFLELRANGVAVASFDVAAGTTAGTHTFPAVNLAPFGGPVTLVARAFVGTQSKKVVESTPVQVTLPGGADTTPPVATILSPTDGSVTNNPTPLLSGQATDAGGAGLDPFSLVLRLDGTPVGATVSNGIASFTPLSPLAPGNHTVTLDARDNAGNDATTATSTFLVDLAPPAIAITAPTAALLNNRRPTLAATITDAGGAGFVSSGIQLLLNGVMIPAVQLQIVLSNGNQTAQLSFTPPSDLADGSHVMTVQAVDRAGNPAPAVSRQFTVDGAPPAIAITSPDGSPVTGTSVPLIASVSDLLSGVNAATIQVTLNGGPVAAAQTPGGGSIGLSGTLTAQAGTNILVVSASDFAGNTSSVTRLFDAGGNPPPPPIGAIVLTIVSGDGQQGLAGRKADQPLVVRATDVSTGAPVPGLPLVFTGGQNAGTFARAEGTASTLTDGGGIAKVRYAFSTKPGANVVTVLVPGLQDTAPVQFQLTGQLPGIAPGEPPSPCNYGQSTSDFPGSALAKLLTVKVTKPDGSPLTGELIRPFVSKFNGQPPTMKVGKFMPVKAFSDQNGEARFAFVIDDGAQPGDFTMQFGLPEFRQTDGTEVFLEVAGKVRDQTKEFRGDPTIDSGQGQIGGLGKELSRPLKAKTNQQGGFIVFKVIEGNGVFKATPNSDVRTPDFTFCGKPIWLLAADKNGFAELNFERSTDVALIEISPGSDVFAVGPHEVSFVSPGLAEIPNIFPVDLDKASSSTSFKVKVNVPKNETPNGDLKSFNSLDEQTSSIQNAVAPPVLNNASLSFQLVGSTAEYDTWASREIINTTQLNLPGQTATPGGGFAFLETTDFGGAEAEVTVLNEVRKFKVRSTQFLKANNPDLRPLIFNKGIPVEGGAQTIKVSFKLGDGEALDKVHWVLGPVQKENKTPEIFLKFKEADDAGHAGTEGDPIVIGIPETKGNTRKDVQISALVFFKDKVTGNTSEYPLRTVVRVALTKRRTDDATDPGTASQDGLKAIANWNAAPPFGITFADPATADPFIKFPQGVNLVANRLSFLNVLQGANAVSYRDDVNFKVYGAIMTGSLWQYPRELIEAIIGHEAGHQKAAFDAQTVNTPFKALSVALVGLGKNRSTLEDYLNCFDHVVLELNDLLDTRVPYRFQNDRNLGQSGGGGPGGEIFFVQAFNAIEQTLVEHKGYAVVKVPIAPLPGVVLPAQLSSDVKTIVKDEYVRAVEAFPELQGKDEFDRSGQLVRPPE